ncbi:HemK2/MTQ2 family protein methyltransferase [Streptomyces sp. NPDC056254]|uniref:HemK2/MTQ2 family protein methyltransferase n=1 Tax=Streptomyces sp. NPDC056254 TaxID=3345763 RepID=UPI0035D76CDC
MPRLGPAGPTRNRRYTVSSTTFAPGAPPAGLIALPGVYRPQADTRFLAEALDHEDLGPGRDVLEIGTGTGALALHAAGRGARVTAVDVSWRALLTARLNALRRRLPLRLLHGDFAARTADRRFDLVFANPPYVPAPGTGLPTHGPERAWDAGPDGRAVIDRICARAPELLRPGGTLLLVHSGMCGAEETVDRLSAAGLTAGVIARTAVPWGPVLRGRRAWLERRALAAPYEEWEELVIIRAVSV